jgi:hypothetical protein
MRSPEDRLRFEKRLDPERTEFAAEAGVLEPVERRLLIVKHAAGLNHRHPGPCAFASSLHGRQR